MAFELAYFYIVHMGEVQRRFRKSLAVAQLRTRVDSHVIIRIVYDVMSMKLIGCFSSHIGSGM